jgi:anaerobic selenocysteine-containing dehydrogenase
VVAPAGEARPNHEVFAELCRRTGVGRTDDAGGAEDLIRRIVRTSADSERIERELSGGAAAPPSGRAPVQFVDVFPRTSDGRVHLFPESLDREAPRGLYGFEPDPGNPRFPLALISPAGDARISSTFGELDDRIASAGLNPDDARARRVAPGDSIRVFNALGEVLCLAAVEPAIRSGVVVLEKGLWSRHTLNGKTSNALVPDALTDLGAGACFNDARVEVERVARP